MLPSQDGLFLEMQMATLENETEVVEQTAAEKNEEVRSAFDRIVNPDKVQEAKKEDPAASTAEELPAAEPTEPAFDAEQIKTVMAQVARIPELEKQLRDAGGRYGSLKQSLEQLQQRITAPASGDPVVDVEEMLAGIKEEFGEDGLYQSLKTAFSKLAAGKSVDPASIEKMVTEKIAATKQAEIETAMELLTEAHPTWQEDRKTPEFKEWMDSLPAKERNRFSRSEDPFYVADKLDDFKAWREKKAAPPAKEETPAPAAKTEHAPSKRLTSAVLPTNGTKPKAAGEDDKKTQVRSAFERVLGNRM